MTLTRKQPAQFQFQLFVAGDTCNSLQAIANLRALCQAYLPDRHAIEIIDVFQQPSRALANEVFMTPTLIKLEPLPARRIVGTLSQHQVVVQALDLPGMAP